MEHVKLNMNPVQREYYKLFLEKLDTIILGTVLWGTQSPVEDVIHFYTRNNLKLNSQLNYDAATTASLVYRIDTFHASNP
jgi:hypothetical protein